MKKINVLVLGVGGNVSQGILKAIALSSLDCNIVGACISSDSLGLYMCHSAYISPYADSRNFIPWLLDVCNKESIDIILTGVEENILAMAKNQALISEKTKAQFISSSFEFLMIGQDKYLTCEWLKENGCNYPLYCKAENRDEVIKLADTLGFPLIAKPRKGKGSSGIIMVTNSQELMEITKLNDYIVQEYIGDNASEYTIGTYCNKSGKLLDIIIMHRELQHGTTFKAEVVENDIIRQEVIKICDKFKPVGPLNIQLRLDKKGRPVCFELNVRFSGTTPMRARFGYNDVAAMIKEYVLNQDVTCDFKIVNGTAYRYINEMYFFDNVHDEINKKGVISDMSQYNIFVDTFGDHI